MGLDAIRREQLSGPRAGCDHHEVGHESALVGLDTDDPVAVADQFRHLHAFADVGPLGPGSRDQRGDDGRCVDLGVVVAEARPEHVGSDRTDLPADFGTVDELYVEAVGATGRDELFKDSALLGGGEVDQATVGAELERHGEISPEILVQRAPGERDLHRPPRVAAVQPHESRVPARSSVPGVLLFEQCHLHAFTRGEVGGGGADETPADDDDGCHDLAPCCRA